jgi:hypothetical protein
MLSRNEVENKALDSSVASLLQNDIGLGFSRYNTCLLNSL